MAIWISTTLNALSRWKRKDAFLRATFFFEQPGSGRSIFMLLTSKDYMLTGRNRRLCLFERRQG